ncbi:hypothetical protein NEUTE1DRAFT_115848 [Neurospora tetrasperma FGSC 2508]|uniref:Uncharacterized protein n=1 Tax=Neurospora tetrasperma (strain FGSC 2508 / ATCC MYA-4615 / P0657) TaxID=510951 RepID=F8MDZ0_NEUT8|nr:uncharacterized protein NEUTE1DRAFT_115848 [Neurospora tetrasperma FGSC 2508]EGO60727.1 hypothetical protein NEUTE1DRAFT_115848 [Neurospora tetrasperma FGSC 2508]EGZ75283.1 hypothetical protein NEUTE2DRAFT_143632 [Neurospora tetrasperma FGSC 2509]
MVWERNVWGFVFVSACCEGGYEWVVRAALNIVASVDNCNGRKRRRMRTKGND